MVIRTSSCIKPNVGTVGVGGSTFRQLSLIAVGESYDNIKSYRNSPEELPILWELSPRAIDTLNESYPCY